MAGMKGCLSCGGRGAKSAAVGGLGQTSSCKRHERPGGGDPVLLPEQMK